MNKKLEQKFYDRWPHWFNRGDSHHSLMGFGFSCKDGWNDLLWQLCLDIEKELDESKFRKFYALNLIRFLNKWNTLMYRIFDPMIDKEYQLRKKFREKFCKPIPPNTFAHYGSISQSVCHFFVVRPVTHFQVVQIKEKFGTLSFYIAGYNSNSNERISRLIFEASNRTSSVCELCGGNSAKTSRFGNYMMETLCARCAFNKGFINGIELAKAIKLNKFE